MTTLLLDIRSLIFLAFVHNLRMKYIDSKKLSDLQFKRYTGISWSTFYLMVEQLKMHVSTKGRPPRLSLEDQVLLCLSYWREHRTLFHVATSYGVSEPTDSQLYVMSKIA
ncbi:transposase family protein [Acinetobacter sp.]|uniref:transposase family protein n=1 Tax=Acinetobacter sp. TaxID=472 RepID=UPI00388E9BA8